MSREKTERNHRLIRFGVLIAILLLAIYGFFDLNKRLEEAKGHNETATPEAETAG